MINEVYFTQYVKLLKKNFASYKKGSSMAEIVVIVAIVTIITSLSITRFSSIKEKQSMETAVAEIVTTLNDASSKTLASVNSNTYGVHFESHAIVIFTGSSYPGALNALGNEPYKTIDSPASISNVTLGGVSGTSGELYFTRLTGEPSKTGTITITSGSFSKVITVGPTGQISSNNI